MIQFIQKSINYSKLLTHVKQVNKTEDITAAAAETLAHNTLS